MAAVDGKAPGKFDICSGQHLPIEDLYWAVADAVGVTAEPGRAEAGADDVKQMELDGARAREVLGWRTKTPLWDGVAAAAEWYAEHGVENTYTHLTLPNHPKG